jgi:hypothetical protein
MASDPLLLRRSFACKCSHGPPKHLHGGCEVCPCNKFDQPLRASRRHTKLSEFWTRVARLGMSDAQTGELISGAENYVMACTLRDNTALVRRGGEIPEHLELKEQLANNTQIKTKTKDASLKRIVEGEADRKRWGQSAVSKHGRKISRLARDLQGTLDAVLRSTTLRSRFAFLHGDQLVSTRECLKWLVTGIENPSAGLSPPEAELPEEFRKMSQSELHGLLLKQALKSMQGATRARRGCFPLMSLAICLASGEKLNKPSNTIRLECRALSMGSKGKRGLSTRIP